MGSSEILHYWLLIIVVIAVIIYILSIFSFKNILNRFGLLKISKREFYECGFKPLVQKSVKLSIQFLAILLFFLLYDIELIFSFPFFSYISNHALFDFLFFIFMYFGFILSLLYDYDRFLTKWRF